MGAPIIGKTEFRNTANQPILIVDPDASGVQLVLQTPTTPPSSIAELTKSGKLTLLGGVFMDGLTGDCRLGGKLGDGDLQLRDKLLNSIIVLEASGANVFVGGNTRKGDLFLFAAGETDITPTNATIHLDGGSGAVSLRSTESKNRIVINPEVGDIHVGGNGVKGDIMVYSTAVIDNPTGSSNLDSKNASIHLGAGAESGQVVVRRLVDDPSLPFGVTMETTITLDGKTGDITLANADVAEDFDVVSLEDATPGTVMTLTEDGNLRPADEAYDTRVAGVVSGAGSLRAGIVLGREARAGERRPIALGGRVACKVDAQYAPVKAGDLLTTSDTPGHAMKVLDRTIAHGAVIGKALAPLATGQGLIHVLVALG